MLTVKLYEIVQSVMPNWCPILSTKELDTTIVLRNGFFNLKNEDVLEIIEATIKHVSSGETPIN